MINNFLILILISGIISLINQNDIIEVSPKYYTDNFLSNTSRIDIYSNNLTDIYLNNESSSNYYLNISKCPEFENIITNSKYNIPINYKIKKKQKNSSVIFLILIFGFIYIIRYLRGMDSKYQIIHANSKNKSKITLDDIAGLEYAKQEVFEFIDFLKNRDKYLEAGAKMPRGALFYGPPGTGKTMLAKAIAGEANINFISASGSDFVEVYVGVGSSRVRQLFQKARKNAPCVIFIDEIDSLARKRSNSSGGGLERDSTLNTLLVELDGYQENQDIFGVLRPFLLQEKSCYFVLDDYPKKELEYF